MNKLILCEGKTDAILLSYYLDKMCGWKYCKKAPKGVEIKEDSSRGESINWYKKDEDYLLICAVGSKNNFVSFYEAQIHNPLRNSDAFSRIALIIDKDDETIQSIEKYIQEKLPFVASKAQNSIWVDHDYLNRFHEKKQLEFLLQVVPTEQQGALETLMLEAISEDDYDRNIVDKSKIFVDNIAPEAGRYIGKRRLITKAYLGVTWAIQSPQKVFTHISDQIQQVQWEKSIVLNECFKQLLEI